MLAGGDVEGEILAVEGVGVQGLAVEPGRDEGVRDQVGAGVGLDQPGEPQAGGREEGRLGGVQGVAVAVASGEVDDDLVRLGPDLGGAELRLGAGDVGGEDFLGVLTVAVARTGGLRRTVTAGSRRTEGQASGVGTFTFRFGEGW